LASVEWVYVGEIGPETNWSLVLVDVTHVIHLAALAHQIGTEGKEICLAFQRINVEGTRRLLDEFVSMNVPGRFCYVSSSGAVCSHSESLITDHTPCHPDSAYGRSKLAAEQLVLGLLNQPKRSWTIIRPALVYGPDNPGNMARLFWLIRTGLPLPLGSIHNRRSFVFVDNLVDALIHCLDHPGAERQILSVNDGEIVSTCELLRLMARASGRRVRIFKLPIALLRILARLGDLMKLLFRRSVWLDTYSLERLVGSHAVEMGSTYAKIQWRPPFTLEEGLRITLGTKARSV
jgi:nucleoside-diphosphate-sugar epimerase